MLKKIPMWLRILVAMVIGVVTGLYFGRACIPLGEIAKLIVNLIKMFATPLLFFAVLDSMVRTKIERRSAAAMLGISFFNAAIAIGVGLAISNLFHPGTHLAGIVSPHPKTAAESGGIDFSKTLVGFLPSGILQPFIDGAIIPLIILAILLGLALRFLLGVQDQTFRLLCERLIDLPYRLFEVILGWLVKLIPIAVACGVARTVGEYGLSPITGLAWYLGAGLAGLLIQVLVVYQLWLWLVAKFSIGQFWRGISDPLVYAMGASSSLATLPVTLRALKKMGISDHNARLSSCVGTNFNNDGILLYEAMATLFVAQAFGIELTLQQQILTAIGCAIAGMGIAGMPEAGLISLSLVLSTVGLPLELLPILISVDWILSRARAMTNVTSDCLVAVLLDRIVPPRSIKGESAGLA